MRHTTETHNACAVPVFMMANVTTVDHNPVHTIVR